MYPDRDVSLGTIHEVYIDSLIVFMYGYEYNNNNNNNNLKDLIISVTELIKMKNKRSKH